MDAPTDPRAAVWMAVARRCADDEREFSPAFVDALSQVAAGVAETLGRDLGAFARHAKRAKVSVDDVRLCARRNPDWTDSL
ncbi:hypothetical protein GGF49_002269 [Coemansia sp. RSA 1853]|nr:hypothetical protein GGF49_002269 [Coemansia sp. RSA 1853]